MFAMGIGPDSTPVNLDIIACIFHWFGVTLSNYVRVIGFIRGLRNGTIKREDLLLLDKTKRNTIKDVIDEYRDNISELVPVQKWRDKVYAHPAITYTWKDDNIATLEMSVIFPVSFNNGRYYVGDMVLNVGNAISELPRWSLTEVFESLVPRFWPGFEIPTIQDLRTRQASLVEPTGPS